MFISVESCSLQSRSANFPSSSFFAIAFCLSGFAIATSCLVDHKDTRQLFGLRVMTQPTHICSNRPCMSPIPRSLDTNGCGANRSRSFKCSPTPRKMIGVLVAATLMHDRPKSAIIPLSPLTKRTRKWRLLPWRVRQALSRLLHQNPSSP